jgi:hypothetical protein
LETGKKAEGPRILLVTRMSSKVSVERRLTVSFGAKRRVLTDGDMKKMETLFKEECSDAEERRNVYNNGYLQGYP